MTTTDGDIDGDIDIDIDGDGDGDGDDARGGATAPVNHGQYTAEVPLYEFRCKTCASTFEVRRPMSEASAPATCPEGHPDGVRLLSVFASVGASAGAAPAPAPSAPARRGCGSACGCH